MTPQRAFARKIIYVVAICLLLIPLYLVAHPATKDSPGGMLAKMREKNHLSETQLGQIDPASETMKLATFGMRGVATTVLWEKANGYKKKKDWANLSATLNVLSELEPHFITVWQNQSWNLAYNVSVEFDDYRDRYHWVIAGIEFLIRGISYNENEPRLYRDVAWYIGHKIGQSDEKEQFRRLFRADDEFHARYRTPSPEARDNWLVAKEWFRRAEDRVKKGAELKGRGELLFYSDRPMSQMYYAEALEDEGTFGEKARLEWSRAEREWTEFGSQPITTVYTDEQEDKPLKIALNDLERYRKQSLADMDELAKMQPDLEEQIRWERWNGLTDAERGAMSVLLNSDYYSRDDDITRAMVDVLDKRQPGWRQALAPLKRGALTAEENAALDLEVFRRTAEQRTLADRAQGKLYDMGHQARQKLLFGPMDIARRITGPLRKRALQLGEEIQHASDMVGVIQGQRDIVAFEHWRRRARAEQTAEARDARRLLFEGKRAFDQGDLTLAVDAYRKGLAKWQELSRQPDHALLVNDKDNFRDVLDAIDDYVKVLEQRDETFPEGFELGDYLRAWVDQNDSAEEARETAAEAEKAFSQGDLAAAKEAYVRATDSWHSLLGERPALALTADRQTTAEMIQAINRYAAVLAKAREVFPEQWNLRSFLHTQLEHSADLAAARDRAAEGNQLLGESKFPEAEEALNRSLAQWRKLLDHYPCLLGMADRAAAAELARTIEIYRTVLDHRGKTFPEDFILKDFVKAAQQGAGK